MSAALSLWPTMTAEQFCSWPGDGLHDRHQLIDGKPVPMNPPSWQHAKIATRLATRLNVHFQAAGLACEAVIGAGVQPRGAASHNVRIPDVAVSCSPAAESRLVADMVFAAEVLSPSNEAETREAVRAYLTIPTVREILVLGSTAIAGELLRREPDGTWPADPLSLAEDDEIVLESLHFRLELAALYRGLGRGA